MEVSVYDGMPFDRRDFKPRKEVENCLRVFKLCLCCVIFIELF